MRLSTASDRDEERAVRVIHAALDGGVKLLDTADAYAHDDSEIGHNERLIATALRTWSGDRTAVEVATKAGLIRPGGRWVADGRARHLEAACEASLVALGVDRIDLYQLHVVDPKTPIETSVRAFAALWERGLIRKIGLCNVTVGQIEAAAAIAEISSVQVSLGIGDETGFRNGVAELCRDRGIRLIAYRPLGGERAAKLLRDPVLGEIAAGHGASPGEIALAWLLDLDPSVVPIPGASTIESARSIGRATAIALTPDERDRLDRRYPAGRLLRIPRTRRRPAAPGGGDVVLVMGMPGAGKSTIAMELEASGYARLNRDRRGGSLRDLAVELEAGLARGEHRWVLDNTYPTRESRNEVIERAWQAGVPVRCVWLRTSLADAQINAIRRMIEVAGRLPMPAELKARGRSDPRFFGPDAQFRYERTLEPPALDEGFETIEERSFVRRPEPLATGRALVLEYDGVLATDRDGSGPALDPASLMVDDERAAVIRQFQRAGWAIFAHAWRPQLTEAKVTEAQVEAGFARVRELIGVPIEVGCCPHPAGPPVCWCRKPIPGLVVQFLVSAGAGSESSVLVGRAPADRTMADRIGLEYLAAGDFFGGGFESCLTRGFSDA